MKGFTRKRGSTFTAYWHVTEPSTGTRRQHSKGGFRTKRAAQSYLNGIVGKVEDGTWRPDQRLTVAQLLHDHWLPAQKARELRAATISQYQGVIDNWIVPRLGGLKVGSLTPRTVVEYQRAMRSEASVHGRTGLSPRSVQLSVGILKTACKWAVENELLGRNPIGSVRRPRSQAPAMKVWTVEQSRRFIEATKDDRLGVAWALLLGRGLRRGELCGLRWPAVDLNAGAIHIDETRVIVDGAPTESRAKTDAGRRRVPIDAHLVALLKAHRARQAGEKLVAGGAYEDRGFVVADELGRPYYPGWVTVAFKRAAKAAGLPVIRLHDTRHTAASLMAADGTPIKVISEVLGHASPTITLTIYSHLFPGMTEQATERLSSQLFG
jgi:integrase